MILSDWKLTPTVYAPSLQVDHIIAEDYEPEIAIYREPRGARYLGIVVDEDSDFRRRLFVPLEDIDLRSLARRATNIRSLVKYKSGRFIVDSATKTDTARYWLVERDLPEAALPSVASRLPEALAAEIEAKYGATWDRNEKPCFHLAAEPERGPGFQGRESAADLFDLGNVMAALGALARFLTGGPVRSPAGGAGSFVVFLSEDNQQLGPALMRYARVMEDVGNGSAKELQKLTPEGQQRFNALFKALAKARMSVLVSDRELQSLSLPGSAVAYLERRAAIDAEDKEPETTTVRRIGRLFGFDPSADTFTLHAIDVPDIFYGTISKDLVRRLQRKRISFEAGYTQTKLYRASITIRTDRAPRETRPSTLHGPDVLEDLELIPEPPEKVDA
jgi:hypothetical protein